MESKIRELLYTIAVRLKRGNTVTIKPTLRCNGDCGYCTLKLTTGKYPVCNEEIEPQLWFAELYRYSNIKEIIISGGEPLLYEGIGELINGLINRGHLVKLFTNLTKSTVFNIKPSWRFRIMATKHKSVNGRFVTYMSIAKLRGYAITVWELGEKTIPGGTVKPLITSNEGRGGKLELYGPDGTKFNSHIELETYYEPKGDQQ